jgi:putative hemolysin
MGSLSIMPAVLGVAVSETVWTAVGAVVIAILVGLSAFFSSSEIAMFSLARHRIESLYEDGVAHAGTVKDLKEDPHRLLVTILVGNNLVNIAMSSIATALLGYYLTQGQAVFAATFGVTALVLLFGEIAPKSYAVEHTEKWALQVSSPLALSERLLYPLVVLFDYLSRLVIGVTGGHAAIETSYVTRDEIQNLIKTGEREGVIEADERQMLQRIFRFNNTIAKEVMTPRLDVTAVDAEDSIEAAIQTCTQSGHERVPVYESDLDTVIGVVKLRDLVREHLYSENGAATLRDLIEPTLHVPESKNVDELLQEMQEERVGMVIVIDEFGTTEGLITTEDIIEEIVGEILEGEEERPVDRVDDNTVLVRGEVNIEEINEALDIELPEGEEFETIAGFIFNRAGRLVEGGEVFTYENIELRAEQVEDTRIRKARVSKHEDSADLPDPEQPNVEEL